MNSVYMRPSMVIEEDTPRTEQKRARHAAKRGVKHESPSHFADLDTFVIESHQRILSTLSASMKAVFPPDAHPDFLQPIELSGQMLYTLALIEGKLAGYKNSCSSSHQAMDGRYDDYAEQLKVIHGGSKRSVETLSEDNVVASSDETVIRHDSTMIVASEVVVS